MLKAVTEFMMAWAEWLIGLIPFALIALLLWIRLQAAGASPHLAVGIILGLFAWVGLAILGLVKASVGWRTGNAWSLAAGALITVACLLILRRRLQRLWEEFPLLPTNGDESRDGEHETG
jgi:sugar phosphate permease